MILDTRNSRNHGVGSEARFTGTGMVVKVLASGAVEILLDDGRSPLVWNSGEGTIEAKTLHHVCITVDARPKVLTFVINGDLCDGGDRPFGYARFNPYMYEVNGEPIISFSDDFRGNIQLFRIYGRPLYTSEAIGNFRISAISVSRSGIQGP